jgi:creatinine amidohydrolase
MQEGWAWAERKWTQVTADTGVGDPRQASAEKGEKYFNAVTQKVAQFFIEVAKTTKQDFYI